ncbi:hypothetical protein RB595_001179 [Gaeumannomyces hyphopodioides]
MRLLSSVAVAVGTAAAVASAADIVVNRVVDDFPWGDPFSGHAAPPGFEATCEATGTFKARQHLLSELQDPEPRGLKPWFKALKFFFGGRPFPGSWNGVDAHGTKRDVILMSYADVPEAVRRWIQDARESGNAGDKWLYGVYHKDLPGIKIKGTATPRPRPTARADGSGGGGGDEEVDAEAARLPPDEDLVVLFAAGAIYHNLPLWVAGGSACEAELSDLSRYRPGPTDGGVAGWVVERTEPDLGGESREVQFKIKAQVLRETEQGRIARLEREREDAEVAAAAAANDAEVSRAAAAAAAAAAEESGEAGAESKAKTAADSKASAVVSDKDEL